MIFSSWIFLLSSCPDLIRASIKRNVDDGSVLISDGLPGQARQ
jgi:hypothetical protein